MFHKLLVCSDGSENALFAARAAAAIAKRFGSEVLLLDVFNPVYLDAEGYGVWGLDISQNAIDATARVQRQAVSRNTLPLFEAAGVACKAFQELGHPVGAITTVAEREHVDLIVLGSRGLSDFKSLILGSVSGGVLRHAPCPVLILHGADMPPGTDWFQRLLLASDGSEHAQKATQAAVAFAQKFGSALAVLTVFEKPGLMVEVADAYGELYPSTVAAHVKATLKQNLEEATRQDGITFTLLQEEGHPAETILHAAAETKSDLIVVGSRGLGGFQSLLLGSVSGSVAHHASCPVLVVR